MGCNSLELEINPDLISANVIWFKTIIDSLTNLIVVGQYAFLEVSFIFYEEFEEKNQKFKGS